MHLLTAEEMREIERAAMETGNVTGRELMERAGQGAVAALSDLPPGVALVLAGPGNNGGDGFVVARHLAARGWRVTVAFYGRADGLGPDARANHDRWAETGATVALGFPDAGPPPLDPCPDLVVDALFGIGLSRPLDGVSPVFDAIEALEAKPVIAALDVPSGLHSDSGRVLGRALPADRTLSFHGPKAGHLLGDGPATCGRLEIVDIGISGAGATRLAGPAAPLRADHAAHKYDHGHALVLAGGPGRGGAGRLAARAALRVGAGLVTLGVPPDALSENAAQLTAIMLTTVADAKDLARHLDDPRLNAICLGPGLGADADTRALVGAALAASRATTLDADALTAFEGEPAALFDQLHPRCVLTPHPGEFRRLFPDLSARLEDPTVSKLSVTAAAAARAGATLLLKGADTCIATAEGARAVHAAVGDRAAPWLATAGAGDVLAGLITGLMAQGRDPFAASCDAAWLHVEAARAFGPGLIAEDLPEILPEILARL